MRHRGELTAQDLKVLGVVFLFLVLAIFALAQQLRGPRKRG
jgi:hypothetical protein